MKEIEKLQKRIMLMLTMIEREKEKISALRIRIENDQTMIDNLVRKQS